jgi:hypothetical protein
MTLESATVFFKRFSSGEKGEDATALRRLGAFFKHFLPGETADDAAALR